MITDKERREVAKRLRQRRKELDSKEPPLGSGLAANADLLEIAKIAKCESKELFYRLADLIDPGVCRNVYDEYEMGSCDNGFECSVCGCRVEDCEGYYVHGTWNYCPKCRRKVVKGVH